MVWTGSEVLIWGGAESGPDLPLDEGRLPRHGAAYDPVADSWRIIPDAPIAGRHAPISAWTGTELLVWGGSRSESEGRAALADGAAYDPARDRWRVLPKVDLGGVAAVGAWLGGSFVVVALNGAARYRPETNRWQSLDSPSLPRDGRIAAVARDRLVVIGFGDQPDPAGHRVRGNVLVSGSWGWVASLETPYKPADWGMAAVGAGDRVIFPQIVDQGMLGRLGRSLELSAVRPWWRTITPCPRASDGAVWSGRFVVGVQAAYDVSLDTCHELPPAPRRDPPFSETNGREFAAAVWTGREYLTWSGGTGGDSIWVPADGAIFRPEVDLSR
jgi:hypothetical protein